MLLPSPALEAGASTAQSNSRPDRVDGRFFSDNLDPKVYRIIAAYRFWAIILPTFGGLGIRRQGVLSLRILYLGVAPPFLKLFGT